MKINCVGCGFKVDLDESYDEFEGQIKCLACGALLDVRLVEGSVKAVRISEPGRVRDGVVRRGDRGVAA